MSKNALARCQVIYLHYMFPIDNFTSILMRGVLSHDKVIKFGLKHRDISYMDIQTRRQNKNTPSGLSIHNYVPLYFATQTPMQYVITHSSETKGRDVIVAQKDLIFIDIKADSILRVPKIFFTDGNAATHGTVFYKDLNDLDKLDWETITCPGDYDSIGSLCYDSEWKRKRASELLIPDRIPKRLFSRLITFDAQARARLLARIKRLEKKLNKTIRIPPIKCRTEVEEIYYYE